MEACALLGVWCSKHKDPSLELACRPPDTQYGLSLRLTSQAGAGLRVGLGCLWEGGGSNVSKSNLALWTSWGDKANVMNKACRGGPIESSPCPFS